MKHLGTLGHNLSQYEGAQRYVLNKNTSLVVQTTLDDKEQYAFQHTDQSDISYISDLQQDCIPNDITSSLG